LSSSIRLFGDWREITHLAGYPITDSLCFLRTVLASALLSIGHSGTVENTTNNMIPNARKVSDSTSPDDDRAVLLEIMVNPRYVSCNFFAVGQSDTGDFPQG